MYVLYIKRRDFQLIDYINAVFADLLPLHLLTCCWNAIVLSEFSSNRLSNRCNLPEWMSSCNLPSEWAITFNSSKIVEKLSACYKIVKLKTPWQQREITKWNFSLPGLKPETPPGTIAGHLLYSATFPGSYKAYANLPESTVLWRILHTHTNPQRFEGVTKRFDNLFELNSDNFKYASVSTTKLRDV